MSLKDDDFLAMEFKVEDWARIAAAMKLIGEKGEPEYARIHRIIMSEYRIANSWAAPEGTPDLPTTERQS